MGYANFAVKEYQHTSEGAEVPIEVVKSKVPLLIYNDVGSIKCVVCYHRQEFQSY